MNLQEFTDSRGTQLSVDRERGVIEGVKILGLKSRNGRRYTREALQKAVALYDGQHVNVDHLAPGQQRAYAQRIGRISDPKLREDGLYGTLQINPKHQLAEQLFYDAQHMPENVGLSHDAEGSVVGHDDNDIVVEEITRVKSVDLVSDPATTRGLFESETLHPTDTKPMTKTIREIVDAHPTIKETALLKHLIEEEPMMAELPVEAPAEADPNEEVKGALKKAAAAIVSKWFDNEMEDSAAMKKLKELKGMKDKAAADEEPAAAVPPAGEPAVESLKAEVADLKGRETAREQLEAEGVAAQPARVKAVARCLTEAERAELIRGWPKDAGGTQDPRSSGRMTESRQPDGWEPAEDAKEFGQRLARV
jgi:hypothetical protein